MKFNLFVLFFVTILSGSAAFADSWSDLYAGSAHVPDFGNHIDDLIRYDRDQCGQLIHDEIEILNAYSNKAALSDSSGAEDLFKELNSHIFDSVPHNGSCYQSALAIYVLHSVFKFDPGNTNLLVQDYQENGKVPSHLKGAIPQHQEGSAVLSSRQLGVKKSVGYASFENLPLTFLTAAVLNKGWVKFLETTPKIGDRDILGLYDCSSTKISIDPSMRPFNLAATFIHELTHLFFDKSLTPEILQEEFSSDGKMNWHALILEDETIAITYTALLQRVMSTTPRSSWDFQIPDLLNVSRTKWPYQMSEDVSLFSKGGPIDTVVRTIGISAPIVDLAGFLGTDTSPNSKTVKRPFVLLQNDGARDLLEQLRPRLWNIVNSPYFPGEALSKEDLEILEPSRHGLELFSLPYFVFSHVVTTNFVRPADGTKYPYFYEGKVPYFFDNEPVKKVSFQGMGELIQSIDDFIQSSDGKSKICELYEKAVSDGELSSYIGTQFDPDSGTQGQPGGGGVRGSTPIHPGGGGVRGSTPIRPGGGGVRGEVSSVHPCVSFKNEL